MGTLNEVWHSKPTVIPMGSFIVINLPFSPLNHLRETSSSNQLLLDTFCSSIFINDLQKDRSGTLFHMMFLKDFFALFRAVQMLP